MEHRVTLRAAQPQDIPLILDFIRGLAEYEKMTDQVVATEPLLTEWIFEKQKAQVLLLYEDDKPAGFALYFYNFSTFLGRAGIYLEDLFVLPDYRGKGYGKRLLTRLAALAEAQGCGRLEWSCLDWNTPSIDFYKSMGAEQMNDWTGYRLTAATLKAAAAQDTQDE